MKHLLISCLIFSLSMNYTFGQESTYNPNRLIVKFKSSSVLYNLLSRIPTTSNSDCIQASDIKDKPDLYTFFQKWNISSVKPAKPSVIRLQTISGIERIYFFDFSDQTFLEAAYQNLKKLTDFEYVEYDRVGFGSGFPDGSFVPNDPGFNAQWGFRNTGQAVNGVPGTPGADINIIQAWDITTGNEDTKISVLDSGIPLTAAEFTGRVLPGYDFANNDDNPTDDLGHGTNIASNIAALGNNSIGIAGLNWKCKIMPVKILNENNFGYYSWWISGIIMAADSGAQVLNMSVGGNSFSSGLQDAVNYALASGSIIVACMMNDNNQTTYYPAGFENVISVGALNNNNNRVVNFCWGSGGSNYGSHIDFVAPGDWILGLHYLNPNQNSYWCGTSQATAITSGLISLILGVKPDYTLQQVYDVIKQFAHDQIGNPAEDTPGWDIYYGWGGIDVYEVIAALAIPADYEEHNLYPVDYSLQQNHPNPFNPGTSIQFSIPEDVQNVKLIVFSSLGEKIAELVNTGLQAGVYKYSWDAGHYASGIYVYQLVTEKFVSTKKMILLK